MLDLAAYALAVQLDLVNFLTIEQRQMTEGLGAHYSVQPLVLLAVAAGHVERALLLDCRCG
jgi:hypothetical protein